MNEDGTHLHRVMIVVVNSILKCENAAAALAVAVRFDNRAGDDSRLPCLYQCVHIFVLKLVCYFCRSLLSCNTVDDVECWEVKQTVRDNLLYSQFRHHSTRVTAWEAAGQPAEPVA